MGEIGQEWYLMKGYIDPEGIERQIGGREQVAASKEDKLYLSQTQSAFGRGHIWPTGFNPVQLSKAVRSRWQRLCIQHERLSTFDPDGVIPLRIS